MNDTSNEPIMTRLAGGDREALGELYDRYAGVVGGIAQSILRDTGAAEDVVQTVFIQVWKQADRYDPRRGSAGAWLTTLARTRALDALRRRTARRETTTDTFHEAARAPMAVDHLAVSQALAALPPTQRETLELSYYEGFTQAEIARMLGIPLGTIKSRARDGLLRLRRMLGPTLPEHARGREPGNVRYSALH